MKFLGDASVLRAEVRAGQAYVGGALAMSTSAADGASDLYVRPTDVHWSDDRSGLPVVVSRVLDRLGSRRIIVNADNTTLTMILSLTLPRA